MDEHNTGQVAASAAEVYDQFFVPALFAGWPAHVLEAADVGAGHQVLDVACGTGVLAAAAAIQVGAGGKVCAVDINDGMLAVARKRPERIAWQQGAAESLPFDDNSFDRVVSQFGLMFFTDRTRAIHEMLRVLRPGGKLAVAVWASLEETPGYAAVANMLQDLFGAEVAASIEAPYCLGDADALAGLFAAGGASGVDVQTVPGTAQFNSIDDWMYTDIKGWTLADVVDDAGYQQLREAAQDRLAEFTRDDGSVSFAAPALIATAAA